MKNGSLIRHGLLPALGVTVLAGLSALPAAAQTPSAKPANCNAYKLDDQSNKIIFNDPRVTVLMPEKKELEKLRSEGTPAQVFLMRNCDAPDTLGDFKVYSEAKEENDPELVPSAVRVVILAEQGDWVQIKGYTSLWKGTGWVKRGDKIVVVKY